MKFKWGRVLSRNSARKRVYAGGSPAAGKKKTAVVITAPAYRSESHGSTFSGTAQALSWPSGIQTGDYCLLAYMAKDTAVRTWVRQQDEWELIQGKVNASDYSFKVLGHRYTAGDTAPTIESEAYTPTEFCWAIVAYSGVDATRPWEARTMATMGATSPSFNTTTIGDKRRLVTYMFREGTVGVGATNPAAQTERLDFNKAGNSCGLAVADQEVATAATTASDWNGSASNIVQGSVALNPSGDAKDITIATDDCSVANEDTVWGLTTVNPTRITQTGTGGPNGGAYRICTLVPGDSENRVELGYNEWRMGDGGHYDTGTDSGTFALFQEGQKMRLTEYIRLASSPAFPVNDGVGYQAINQFKATQPNSADSANPTNGQSGWDLQVRTNNWRLTRTATNQVTTEIGAVAVATNTVYKHVFEVLWTKQSSGWLKWYVNDNLIATYDGATLGTTPTGGSDDYFDVGMAIPQHWRAGVYRNSSPSGNAVVHLEDFKVELLK